MGGGESLEGAENKLHIPHFLVSTGKASRQMKSATRHPAMTTGTYVVIPLLELGCDKCKCYRGLRIYVDWILMNAKDGT